MYLTVLFPPSFLPSFCVSCFTFSSATLLTVDGCTLYLFWQRFLSVQREFPPLCHQEVSFLTGDFGIAWFLFIIFFFFSFLPCNMKNHEGSIDLSVYLYIYGLSSPCYYKKQACRHLHRPLRSPSNDNIYVEPLTCLKKSIWKDLEWAT